MSDKVIRKFIRFHGSVQGVGFRYRALYAAKNAGVTGWVMNCYDGTVEMEVQGSESQIDELIIALDRGRFISITSMDVSTIPVIDERGFDIKY